MKIVGGGYASKEDKKGSISNPNIKSPLTKIFGIELTKILHRLLINILKINISC